jgi:polyvinyl alcohol dehydrogenase (cytochrome)
MGSIGAGEASAMPNRCTANPPMRDPARGPSWNGSGNDLANTRFQSAAAARLTAADVPRLKLKWAFGSPEGVTNNAQPTVVSGRVFAASDNGYIYSLDAKTGCVYWSFQNGSIVRNSPMVGAVSGQGTARWAVFFGDGHANVFALDAQTGRQLWKTRVDPHVVACITAGVKCHEGRVYVQIFREAGDGRLFAVSATDGSQLWEFNTVQDVGTANNVPARGGAIATAGAVVVDGMVYIATGSAQAGNVLLAFGVD